jgi:hypothetical protein
VAACALAASIAMAGCSGPGSSSASPSSLSSGTKRAAAAAPSPRNTSAFCLDLRTFQAGVVVFRGDVGKATRGQALDFSDLRERAALIAVHGEKMQPTAPPDIAEEFESVLDAITISASMLKPGSSTRDVVDPLYGERYRGAFDAVNEYKCR